jgi:hypothetical protein
MKKLKTLAVVVAMIAGLVGIVATPAEAKPNYPCAPLVQGHVVSEGGKWWFCLCVYIDDPEDDVPDDFCAWVALEDGDNSSGTVAVPHIAWNWFVGVASSLVQNNSYVDASVWSLDDGMSTPVYKPAGSLAIRSILRRWTGSAWQSCGDTGYLYNSVTTYAIGYGVNRGFQPCGSGYYYHESAGYSWDGSAWRGGSSMTRVLNFISPLKTSTSAADADMAKPPLPQGPATKLEPPPDKPPSAIPAAPKGVTLTYGDAVATRPSS